MTITALGYLSGANSGLGKFDYGGVISSVVSAGAGAYAATQQRKAAEAMANAGGQQVNYITNQARQLTKEEIEEHRKDRELARQHQIQDQGIKLYNAAQQARFMDAAFDPPKDDNTNVYILGGLLFLGIIVMMNKK